MVFVEVCVGSSCHLKGAPEIVELMRRSISEYGFEDRIVLSGSFCTGRCNRVGVTVTVGDETIIGVTKDNFNDLWVKKILPAVKKDEEENA